MFFSKFPDGKVPSAQEGDLDKTGSLSLFPLRFRNHVEESHYSSHKNVQTFFFQRRMLPVFIAAQIFLILMEFFFFAIYGSELDLLGLHTLALILYCYFAWKFNTDLQNRYFYVQYSSGIGTAIYCCTQIVLVASLMKIFPNIYIELW